jgi:threonine/homoserine/homoserine lactone efflux protein
MELSIWLSIASICAIGAMSPGPSLGVVIRNTISGGRLQGVLTGIGHALGVGLYSACAIFGVAALLSRYPNALRVIEILGGLYLAWLGFQSIRFAGKGSLNDDNEDKKHQGFLDGFAISGLNPKIAIFFLALLGPLIPPDASNIERLGVTTMAMLIDGIWYVSFALLLVQTGAKDWLSAQGKRVDLLLGTILLGLGIWLLI